MTYQPLGAPAGPGPQVRMLRRSRTDRILGGVCAGLGRYLGIDPLLLRIAAVALALSGGAGVLAYVIAWIVIPEATPGEEPSGPAATTTPVTVTVLVGGLMLAVGAVLLLRHLLPWFELGVVWPVLLLVVGALVVVSGVRRRQR